MSQYKGEGDGKKKSSKFLFFFHLFHTRLTSAWLSQHEQLSLTDETQLAHGIEV